MINMLHTASSPGLRDTLDPVRRRRRLRRRRRRELAGTAEARAAVLSRSTRLG